MLREILAGIATVAWRLTRETVRDRDACSATSRRRAPPGAAGRTPRAGAAASGQGGGARQRQPADRGAVGGDVAEGEGVRRQGEGDRRRRSRSAVRLRHLLQGVGRLAEPDRATVGVPNSEPKLQPYPAPSPAQVVGGQRLFDNFYWIGNTGIGAWLITSNDGYILFDTMNSEDDAQEHHHPGDQEAESRPEEDQVPGLRPQPFRSHRRRRVHPALTGAKAVMHRDDWEIYLKSRAAAAADAAVDAAPTRHAETATAPPPRRRRRRCQDEARHRRHRRHELNGRRRDRDHLPDDRPHARFDRHGRAGAISGPPASDPARDGRHRRAQPRGVRRRLRAHLGRSDQDEGRERDAGASRTRT